MTMVRIHGHQIRAPDTARTYRNLMAAACGGVLVLAFAFAMLIVLAA